MKVNHFVIYRWGTERIHWDGTSLELHDFKKWVETYVPKKYFDWDKHNNKNVISSHRPNEFHISGCFDTNTWTFLCYYWTTVCAPCLNQIWTEKKNEYGNKPEFGEAGTLLQHDNAVLNLTWANLQKQSREQKTPEVKACIRFLYKNWLKVNEKYNKEIKRKTRKNND